MISVTLPDGRKYDFTHAVFDYNGTIAEDGLVPDEIKALLTELTRQITVTVVTADTFGLVENQLRDIAAIQLEIIKPGQEARQKAALIKRCGAENTVCFGNGANDKAMFALSAIAVAVVGPEGACWSTVSQSDIVVTNPKDAISLLLKPKRLIATLRT